LLAAREAEDILQWLKKKTGPPATTVTTQKDIDSLMESDDVCVVGFFKVCLYQLLRITACL